MRASISGGFKFKLGETQIGNVTAINYSNSRTSYIMERNDWGYSQIGSSGQADEIFTFLDHQYSNAIRLGVSHNWSARFKGGRSLNLKTYLINYQILNIYRGQDLIMDLIGIFDL